MEEGRKYLLGSKWRREVDRVFVCFNHKQNGQLCTQWFSTTLELPNSHETRWVTVQTSDVKIEEFKKSDWVANVTHIPEAKTAEEAIALAKFKYGMKPLTRVTIGEEK